MSLLLPNKPLKQIVLPHLGIPFTFGRLRPRVKRSCLPLANYLPRRLPTPPLQADYSAAALRSLRNPYVNNQHGDCVLAALLHIRSMILANVGREIVWPDAQCIA